VNGAAQPSLGGSYQDRTFKAGCWAWYLWGADPTVTVSLEKPCPYAPGSIEANGCDQSIINEVA